MYSHWIDTGSGYVEFTPINENQKIKRVKEDNQVFARDYFDGTLIFVAGDYDDLQTLSATNNKLDYQLKLNGKSIFQGYVDLLGTYIPAEKRCELKVITADEYTDILSKLDETVDIITSTSIKYGVDAGFVYTRNQKLRTVMQTMIESADSSILFDGNSWGVFDSFNTDWEHIFIAGISDIILDGGAEKSNEQTLGELSLNDIFNLFAELFHVYWYLEDVSGSYYFRFDHISDITISSGGTDLTSYRGVNWTTDKSYTYREDNRFYKIQRSILAGNTDFIGYDIEMPNFENIGNIKKLDINTFMFDIEDCYDNPSKYPDSTSQFMLLQATENLKGTMDESNTLTQSGSNFTITQLTTDSWRVVRDVVASGEVLELTFSSLVTHVEGDTCRYQISRPATSFTKVYLRPKRSGETQIISGGIATINADFGDGAGSKPCLDLTGAGGYDFWLQTSNASGNHVWEIYLEGGGVAASVSFAPISFYYNTESYLYESQSGIITGADSKYNYKLSLANIDDVAGGYELPDTTAIINGVSTTVEKKNDKVAEQISFPLEAQTDIDFSKTITTDLGQIEPKELTINMDGSPATLTGDYK